MRSFFTIFLRFSRNEQLGLVVLFTLVLAVIFAPMLFSSAAATTFHYDVLVRRIDSLTVVAGQPSPPPRTTASSPPRTTATPPQTYTPFKRESRSMPIVDLNSADTNTLRLVRGIGAYFARSIVKYREQLGGYAHIQQLLDIRNVDPDRLAQWMPQLTLDTAKIVKIDLATADEQTLRQHPYIGYYAARGIVHFRTTQGAQACTLRALVENNILNSDVAGRLMPYCSP
ncbi:MAG: helix-hairpin-helix domain-containing protein [Prevotellaceae bacterium]|jgi:DNA uptake protein ComE-like DNA-binding protein|nr:helix-hairpin-helix domain-containing protein [Prevotellaceae bacterium]